MEQISYEYIETYDNSGKDIELILKKGIRKKIKGRTNRCKVINQTLLF